MFLKRHCLKSTARLINQTQYDTGKQKIEKNIKMLKKNKLNSSWLVEKTNYNTKIVEIGIEMYDASGLVSKYGFNSRLKILDIKYMMLGEWSKRLITNKNRGS